MNELRKKRLESTIQKELAGLIHKHKARDDRLGLISVTRIVLAPDLSTVTAFVSLFDTEEANKDTWACINHTAGKFQSALCRNLRLRQTPRLKFKEDNSIKEGDRLLDMME